MTIARLKKAIDEPLSQDERDELARHERRLTRIADCAEVVDIPDTAAESPSSQSTAGRPRITPRVPRFDRTSQDGL